MRDVSVWSNDKSSRHIGQLSSMLSIHFFFWIVGLSLVVTSLTFVALSSLVSPVEGSNLTTNLLCSALCSFQCAR